MDPALLITDDPATRRVAKEVLTAEGYEIVECPDVQQVRATASSLSPAIVLVDIAESEDTTNSFCRALRGLPGLSYVPLILVSGNQKPVALRRAYDAQITTVLKKPLDQSQLQEFVQSVGDTGRTLSGIRAVRASNSQIMRSLPDAFFLVGKDGLLRQYIGGGNDDRVLLPTEIEGQKIKDVWPRDVATQVMQKLRRVLKSRDGDSVNVDLHRGGLRNTYEIRLLVQGCDRVLMVLRCISDGRPATPLPGARNASDTLTGLTARDVFMTHFDALITDAKLRERGIAVFCIDIDRFTRINETLGRAVGDGVLRITAKRIERCLRESDQLARIDDSDGTSLTRISGDEFVLVLADIESREDVRTVASRVQAAFDEPVNIDGHELWISPSIGISQYPLDGNNATELLKNARVALDEAKILAVNGREFYSSTMKFRTVKRFDLKDELRWAIDKKQLELRYLPRIDLDTGHAVGLEALLRWMHPLRGSVPLGEVIPLAETTGMMCKIGEWVLATTCTQAKLWREDVDGVPPVSVNLSQQEFTRGNLADLVAATLERNELHPSCLELEVTESMLMRYRQSESVIRKLDEIGVGIVIDDFGQGHSSVAHLSNLPIKAIKIDREFINGVRENREKQAICSAMIAMSRELGLSVIAEGVECELQAEFLRKRGCDAVQGFLYTEPLPAASVPAFLKACRTVANKSTIVDLSAFRQQISIETAS